MLVVIFASCHRFGGCVLIIHHCIWLVLIDLFVYISCLFCIVTIPDEDPRVETLSTPWIKNLYMVCELFSSFFLDNSHVRMLSACGCLWECLWLTVRMSSIWSSCHACRSALFSQNVHLLSLGMEDTLEQDTYFSCLTPSPSLSLSLGIGHDNLLM